MKKLFVVFAVIAFFTVISCNMSTQPNTSTTDSTKVDSTKVDSIKVDSTVSVKR